MLFANLFLDWAGCKRNALAPHTIAITINLWGGSHFSGPRISCLELSRVAEFLRITIMLKEDEKRDQLEHSSNSLRRVAAIEVVLSMAIKEVNK